MSDDKREELLNMYLVSEVGAHVGSTLRDALAEAECVLVTKKEAEILTEGKSIVDYTDHVRTDQRTKDAEIVRRTKFENPESDIAKAICGALDGAADLIEAQTEDET